MLNITRKLLACALGCGMLISAGQAFAADQKPIVIKFPYVVTNDTPKGQGALMLQKLVKQRLGDKVKVELFPNSSLYNAAAGLNALVTGDVQMMAPGTDKLSQYSKAVELFDLPFLFDDMNAVSRFEDSDAGKQVLMSMQDRGILGLSYWHNGMREMSANTPLIEPSDARGLKLRTASADVLAAQVNVLHAIPRKMAFEEVYQGMQTGVIDGQGGDPYSDIESQKWHEVQSDITESNSGVLDYMLITNAKFWSSLPEDVRKQLGDIISEVTRSVNDKAEQLNQNAKARIVKAGASEIHDLSEDEVDEWREAMQPVVEEYGDEIGRDLIKAAQASNETHQSTNKSR